MANPYPSLSEVAGASRISGVAPLGVIFNADLAAGDSVSRPLQDYRYEWDFDDAGAGNWGASGLTRETDTGPVAFHLFESAGSYTVTLNAYNENNVLIDTDTFVITVTDPDTVFSGTNTIVVNNVADSDFTGKPTGATEVNSDDWDATINTYLASGKRILFKRGGTWISSTMPSVPPVTTAQIGAYGTGTSPDGQGHFTNAPIINVADGTQGIDITQHTDLRITDLSFSGSGVTNTIVTGNGGLNIQHFLFLNNKITGFWVGLLWNDTRTQQGDVNIGNMVVNNDFNGAEVNNGFIGGERLAFVGNIAYEAITSHVWRIYHAYVSAIAHNQLSGGSTGNSNGRHALKIHGPLHSLVGDYATTGADGVDNPTKFVVVSKNTFGTSGPWPCSFGPTDSTKDERLSDFVVEKNRFVADFGEVSPVLPTHGIIYWGTYATLKNNVFDGTGSSTSGYQGIEIEKGASSINPEYVDVLHNTVYSPVIHTNQSHAVLINSGTNITAKNNLFCFPNTAASDQRVAADNTGSADVDGNLSSSDPLFVDASNISPLLRDFSVSLGSSVTDSGVDVFVFDDYEGSSRSQYDVGAYDAVDVASASPGGENSGMVNSMISSMVSAMTRGMITASAVSAQATKVQEKSAINSTSTTTTLTFDQTATSGGLLFLIATYGLNDNQTFTLPSGYTALVNTTNRMIAYKYTDGTETSVDVVVSGFGGGGQIVNAYVAEFSDVNSGYTPLFTEVWEAVEGGSIQNTSSGTTASVGSDNVFGISIIHGPLRGSAYAGTNSWTNGFEFDFTTDPTYGANQSFFMTAINPSDTSNSTIETTFSTTGTGNAFQFNSVAVFELL